MTSSKIIVGVDGSASSERAVRWCAEHAAGLDAEVIAVHVSATPIYVGKNELPIAPPSAEQQDALRDQVRQDWCKALIDAGVPHRVFLMHGSPATALMRAAAEEDAGLVVTGKRGRGGFGELLLGSTSHQLSHHLDRPLTIVP